MSKEDLLPDWHAGVLYNPKDRFNVKDFQNRQLFLRVAAENVPDFAQSFLKAAWALIADWTTHNGPLPGPESAGFTEYSDRFSTMAREWAKRFNMETDWVLDEMHDIAIVAINYNRNGVDPALAFGTWRTSLRPTATTRSFDLPAWDPSTELQADYAKRADAEWQRARDAYIETRRMELKRAGFKPVPVPRNRRLSRERRFTWAALHRCAGTSIDDLADQYNEETEAIRISVSRVLKQLGFPPT